MRRLALLCCLFASLRAADTPLKLERFEGPDATFTEEAGTFTVRGPLALRITPASPLPAENTVLEMEYFCAGGVPALSAVVGPQDVRSLPPLAHRETWGAYVARLAAPDRPLPTGWSELRLELPLPAKGTLQLRSARLRAERPGEFDPQPATSTPTAADAAALERYLAATYTSRLTRIQVETERILIEGEAAEADLQLAEIPMEWLLDDPGRCETFTPIPQAGRFSLELPRRRDRQGRPYDRFSSRWQLVRPATGGGVEALSAARYADDIVCRSPDLPPARPKNKKGLGGWHAGPLPGELDELGISAVTVNVMVHSLIALEPGPDTTPFEWQGRTYYAREKNLAGLDATFLEAAKRDVMVSAILLVANPAGQSDPVVHLLGHPDATREGIFAMPNVTSAEGISLYGAALHLMAERWSRPDGKYGRVHHWIMHNEVDAGWVWTNAGAKPAVVYMDLYQRSMRLMDLIARQYDPNSRPFITLTHHWAWQGEAHWYGSRRMIDLLTQFSAMEGDFPWAVAYHPYPQDLFNPRAWEDDMATFSFDSKKITPKNLEVLDAYMKQPALLYRGRVRPVHFSENGFNSPDYSEARLAEQAAGMALAWKKIATLSSVESWQYHNWIDNRGEGGLRIGLRKFPDEPGDPYGRKPIWTLYQALGTPTEDQVAAPYLKTIGISSWDEVIHRGPIR